MGSGHGVSGFEKGERRGGEVWGKSRGAYVKPWAKHATNCMGLVTSSRPAARWYMYHPRLKSAAFLHEMKLTSGTGGELALQPFTGRLSKTGRAHLQFI